MQQHESLVNLLYALRLSAPAHTRHSANYPCSSDELRGNAEIIFASVGLIGAH